ncbi:serine hydrolase domain-containing protein [Amycolatopsis sp. DG1A-15b]|uniref:serine hydrolase domain-containing protein n=1 Tax=Amycolatopsis sp. DG1A-15b TaxID=3052846 RepID=UPI00255B4A46|nr:serine hydrolase domain-containing protein [Amycolatopsis sp. DG1A-15b]WIX90812.1 serine hydrolase domain-containing protein [Amycolatopsis sp. DG1A-15b]
MRRLVLSAACAVLVFTGSGTGVAAAAADPRQTALDTAVQAGNVGMVAIAADPAGRWRGRAGVADVVTGAKPDTGGRFRIGSVSKTFTAALVLKLAAKGRLGLDEPIAKYLPGLLPYPEPITVRQLLQHTSGLPRDLAPQYTWTTAEELDTERFVHFGEVEAIHDSTVQPLLFPPGTSWSYSNTGYNVLALLVEKLTGRRFEQVLADWITGPLHLADTFLPRDFPLVPHPAIRGYEQLYPAPHGLTDVTVYNLSRYFGAGNVISSATDLNRFFHALFDGELLPADLLAQMKTTVPWPGQGGLLSYGLGLMRLSLAGICGPGAPDVWGHGGDVPGYSTWSMSEETATRQITVASSPDLTASPAAASGRILAMVTEFCSPALPGAQAHAAQLQAAVR